MGLEEGGGANRKDLNLLSNINDFRLCDTPTQRIYREKNIKLFKNCNKVRNYLSKDVRPRRGNPESSVSWRAISQEKQEI